ncbi:sulfurtransferase TusA family protein [Streptomyces sp. NPDC056568]|uniref:sulfurtransferase TusA family protein n=1 Tax=Streptomyces sp. NPDC056568 TaxID=3345866 RepID=UPI0036881DB4
MPGITVDGTGVLRVALLLCLRKAIDGAQPGVIASDPAAPLDLPAWCHTTGHHDLGPAPESGRDVYALRLTPQPMATDPMHPGTGPNRATDVHGCRAGRLAPG